MLVNLKEILKIAKSELPVLIMGERGVGKNLIANLIHSISTRKNNVFYHDLFLNVRLL